MLKNLFKITLRNLIRNKVYTIINVAGLALGIVCSLIIFLILKFEWSFDNHHHDSDRIYRIVSTVNQFGEIKKNPGVPYPLPEALRNDFPEIEAATIVDANFTPDVISVKKGNSVFRYKQDEGIAYVDPDYFEIFTYNWLMGDPRSALVQPKSVVLSEGLALKYFGEENPLGKIITFDNKFEYHVTGVVEDVPQNTDLPLNMLLAYNAEERGQDGWGSIATVVQCYLKLPANVRPAQIEDMFPAFQKKYMDKKDAENITMHLQPLLKMHFDPDLQTFSDRTVAPDILFALGLIGLFLLITAGINFVNLNTALAIRRAKEVGVRKVLGSSKSQLVCHFMAETGFTTFLAVLASLALAEIILPGLKFILGFQLSVNIINNPPLWIFLLILFFVVTIFAGFYPALYLARFSPKEAISAKFRASYGKGLSLRQALVVVQFGIAQFLIISTIVITSQISFFQKADMGFDKEAVVEVGLPSNDPENLQEFKNKLLDQSYIESVSFSNTGTASDSIWGGDYSFNDSEQIKEGRAQIKFVDEDFIKTYQLDLLAGEPFQPEDTLKKFMVNQTFVEHTGNGKSYQDVLGKYVKIWGREAPITAVVKDFNTTSLREKVEPVILVMQNRYYQAGIKINTPNARNALAAIKSAWLSVFPQYVFDYSFLDDTIAHFYEEQQKTARTINTFTIIAIIIGCLGLFGLASYMAIQRTKEIGIRKVLGSTVTGVVTLLSKDFLKLVLLGNLIAWPVAWYVMNRWLQNFAYRINISWWIFTLAGGLALIITLLTVSTQAIKAAMANPMESLRYE